MANEAKKYYCKYCGYEKIITDQFRSTCSNCHTQRAMIRREEDKIPMYKTRLETESENERS